MGIPHITDSPVEIFGAIETPDASVDMYPVLIKVFLSGDRTRGTACSMWQICDPC